MMAFTGLVSIVSLSACLSKHNFQIISCYFIDCKWPFSNQDAAYQQGKWHAYREQMLRRENVFYNPHHSSGRQQKYLNTKVILKAVFWAESSWNWLVSLDDLPVPRVQFKGHRHIQEWHEIIHACSWLICTAQCIALGKQCQAVSSHTAGEPCQDTYLVYGSDTALFNPSPLHCSKGGTESSPTKLVSCHSLTATSMICFGNPKKCPHDLKTTFHYVNPTPDKHLGCGTHCRLWYFCP